MHLSESRTFDYVGYHGCKSKCHIRVFSPDEGEDAPYLVIATELEDNPGTSVTNVAEHLAYAVWRYLECPSQGLTWVEHYCDRAFIGSKATMKETWDLVTFKKDARGRFIHPQWRPVHKSAVEEMLGCPL